MKFYRINGTLPGIGGLIVEGMITRHCNVKDLRGNAVPYIDLLEVSEIIRPDSIVGDRPVRFPISEGTLYLNANEIFEIDDPSITREYAADNPFGEYLYEGRFQKDNLVITHAVYKDAVTVTITETSTSQMKDLDKTLFTANFFENKLMALELVDELLHDRMDPEDLIFELRNLQEK
jgi:hypothetical protein